MNYLYCFLGGVAVSVLAYLYFNRAWIVASVKAKIAGWLK